MRSTALRQLRIDKMAEFVPDGHKYGVRWTSPWGPGLNDKSLGFSETGFVVSIKGGGQNR